MKKVAATKKMIGIESCKGLLSTTEVTKIIHKKNKDIFI